MSGLVPFNRHGLSRLDSDFTNMIDDFFSNSWPSRSLLNDTFKMDITEDEQAYYMEIDMPGVKKEEISLDLNNGRFTVSVSREESSENNQSKNILHRERKSSSMTRSVFLKGIDDEGITAKLKEGVLYVTIPKIESQQATGKKIEIE